MRSEKHIKKACLDYLRTLENQGLITWVDRLNSGKFYIRRIARKGRLINGCRAGTPDSYVILNDGRMLWIEYKAKDGKITQYQHDFARMVTGVGHLYLVIRSLDELMERMAEIMVD